jgi:NADPH:quinone reductase-like Zn-dependent oxidoreductase
MTLTMRAATTPVYGDAQVLVVEQLPRPEPLPTEVLVRVHAAGVNPVDWKTRAGGGMAFVLGDPPHVLGWDVSGVVEAVGYGVTRFQPGDEVFGMPRFPAAASAYAEYVTAPSRHFAAKPASLTHVEAAALPLAGLTAWQVLVDTAALTAGQRVLVHAGAGGVGHLAVQIAKARGAFVIATARAAKHEFLRGLGADEAIDYTAVDVGATVRAVDVVVDLLGGTTTRESVATLAPGGLLVAVLGSDPEVRAAADAAGVRLVDFLVEPDAPGLEALATLVNAGQLRVALDTVLPLEHAAKAHEVGETGRTQCKIVLDLTA